MTRVEKIIEILKNHGNTLIEDPNDELVIYETEFEEIAEKIIEEIC